MYTIVYALKKHYTLRIFLTVALSLAMAVAVGSGIHPTNAGQTGTIAPASVAPANNAAATDNSAARLNPAAYNATNSSNQATSLDQAIKSLSSLERDRNSVNSDPTTNLKGQQPDSAQTGNSALQNNLSVSSNK